MVDHATAKYLNDNIGTVLAKALAEMSVAQPNNGVDFLAQWLNTYAEQEEAQELRVKQEKTLEEERAKEKGKQEEKEARAEKRKADGDAKVKLYDDLMKEFGNVEDAKFMDGLWTRLVKVAQTLTGATSVYLAFVDEEGLEGQPGPLLCYDRATEGSEFITEKTLEQGKGVTWGAVTENAGEEVPYLWKPELPPPPAEGEEGEAPKLPPYLPVFVECVTDAPEVHYFDLTRLGSYLAVPLVYTSYYTAEALTGAKTYEEEKIAEAKRREEAKAAAEAAAADGTADPEAEKQEEEPVEEKPMVLQGKTVKMVLCLDTLGTNISFEAAKIPQAIELCNACGKFKEAAEMKQVDEQALKDIDAERREMLEKEIAEVRQRHADDADLEAEAANDENNIPYEEEELKAPAREAIKQKYNYIRCKRTAVEMKDAIMEMLSWVVVPPELLNTLAAMFYMFLYTKEQLYQKGKSTLKWEHLQTLINNTLFDNAFEKVDVGAERKDITPEQKLASVKAMLPPDFDEDKAKAIGPEFEVLWSLIQSAVTYRQAELDSKRAVFEKEKKEAEEEQREFKENLEDRDDDFKTE